MATRGRPPAKDTKAEAKAKPAKATKPVAKATKKPAKTPVFDNAVKKKQKAPKPTIQNSTIIGKMADSITSTFS